MYTIVLAAALTASNATPASDIQQDIRALKKEVDELRQGQMQFRADELKQTIAGLRERLTDQKLDELRRDIRQIRYEEVVPTAAISLSSVAGLTPVVGRTVVTLRVPAGASFFANNTPVALTSATPTFLTPPLEPGRDYFYDFKVTSMEDGKLVTRMKRVTVRAGGLVRLNYEEMEVPR